VAMAFAPGPGDGWQPGPRRRGLLVGAGDTLRRCVALLGLYFCHVSIGMQTAGGWIQEKGCKSQCLQRRDGLGCKVMIVYVM
jgi:hypothetical protein